MKIKLDANGNAVLDEHGNPIMVDDDGKEIPTFSAEYVKQLREEAKTHRIEKSKFKDEIDALKAKFDSVDLEYQISDVQHHPISNPQVMAYSFALVFARIDKLKHRHPIA